MRITSTRLSPQRVGLFLATLAFTTAPAVLAGISDLTAFIQRTEKMAQFNRPLRADVRVTRPDGSHDSAVVIIDPAREAAFIAARNDGLRALVPLAWKAGRAVVKEGSRATDHPADEVLGELGFRATDWFPIWARDYSTAFISDETPHEKTVTIYGGGSIPYSLFVVTFDKERMVPKITKYFREQLNNLVRLRSDEDYVIVGARPRPRKVTITDYVANTTYVYDLTWGEMTEVPAALFDTGSFSEADVEFREVEASTGVP